MERGAEGPPSSAGKYCKLGHYFAQIISCNHRMGTSTAPLYDKVKNHLDIYFNFISSNFSLPAPMA